MRRIPARPSKASSCGCWRLQHDCILYFHRPSAADVIDQRRTGKLGLKCIIYNWNVINGMFYIL